MLLILFSHYRIVEVVGDVKIKISVEDDEDDYEEIFDEPKVEDIPQVNEDYLSE